MEDLQICFTDEELNNISREFFRLKGTTYLDHAGATLYSESQIKAYTKDLTENIYLNPHTSKQTTDCIDQVRYQILSHFNTDSNHYSLIFTSGSTASLKAVAESFQYKTFGSQAAFVYLEENHTSVLGMRELAASKSAHIVPISLANLSSCIAKHKTQNGDFYDANNTTERALFVFPAQCNFSGVKHDLNWIGHVQNCALNTYTDKLFHKTFGDWSVMLDAACFVSTSQLDLSKYNPDFVCLSFYKIFGFPTGLGALLVKNTSAHLLDDKPYYGGGTVDIAMSRQNFHLKRKNLQQRFEDGTISFLSILALKYGFDTIYKLIPKQIGLSTMDRISFHTFNLAKQLYHQLRTLHHCNGSPAVCLYNSTPYDSVSTQGGIVNFNLLRSNGEYIGYVEVIHMAELFNIHLRSGCFCNPGACQTHLKLSQEELIKHLKAGHVCGDANDLVDGVPTGSIRASFGYMSTVEDANSLVDMIIKCFVEGKPIFKTSEPHHVSLLKNIDIKDLNIEKKSLEIDSFKDLDLYLKNESSNAKFFAKGILKAIHIYPVKSCGSYQIKDEWELGKTGLLYDREWMIVKENGTALTQKHSTRMCMIKPRVYLESDCILLSFPGEDDKGIISLNEVENSKTTYQSLCQSKVCGDNIAGHDCGDDIATWLSTVLEIPGLRLIRQSKDEARTPKNKQNNVGTAEKNSISLSNQAQYLAVNLASVRWLASKVESDDFANRLDNLANRFRGNFIIETDKEFEELRWKKIKIGSATFQAEGPCTRCYMICIDQENGEKTTEPLRTISKQFQGKLNFGVYLSNDNVDLDEYTYLIKCGETISIS